jgi:hypothetical protein
MRISYPLFGIKTNAIALTIAAIIIMVVLLDANVTMTNAQQQEQQQQQLSTSQPITSSVTQNGTTATTTLFESTKDSFRVQLPEGWVIQDVNNTGFVLAAEVTEGYGILAQLCPGEEEEEGQQQQGALTNVSTSTGSCEQQAQEDIIHIIRYPNLSARLGIALADIIDVIPDSVLRYQIEKLHEVGYRPIEIVNITNTAIPVHYNGASGVLAAVPARVVVMTYSTDSAPSEMRTGYIILTATNITPPNLQTITGYSIFYEAAAGATGATVEESTPSGSLSPDPAALAQILNSFELMASEEGVQSILAAIAQQAAVSDEPNDQEDEAEEEDEAE